ncbi:MAG: hypothetical protein QW637_06870, partial [Acidilobaceae archaeon]
EGAVDIHERLALYIIEEHRRVIEELTRRFGVEVIDYPTIVVPEFRFIEVKLEEEGKEEEIRSIVSSITNSRVKVDWIDTSR